MKRELLLRKWHMDSVALLLSVSNIQITFPKVFFSIKNFLSIQFWKKVHTFNISFIRGRRKMFCFCQAYLLIRVCLLLPVEKCQCDYFAAFGLLLLKLNERKLSTRQVNKNSIRTVLKQRLSFHFGYQFY